MKSIVWKSERYKSSDCVVGYINHIKVGVITPKQQNGHACWDGSILLPGLPKACNRFCKIETAKNNMEERIQLWFKAVEQ